jgi:hypothetical protein
VWWLAHPKNKYNQLVCLCIKFTTPLKREDTGRLYGTTPIPENANHIAGSIPSVVFMREHRHL